MIGLLDLDVPEPRFGNSRSVVCDHIVCIQKTSAPEPRFLKGASQDVLWSATGLGVRECPARAGELRNCSRAELDL